MKLDGFKVVDLSQFLPGPYLTLALADHGAEVIKIEPPTGDPGRGVGLSDGPDTVFFRCLNRGKSSLSLDLKAADGLARLLELCETADVLVESFRPGVADRLGVGYGAVRARNPAIVYCSISAFGQEGPYRDRPAHDLAVEAVAGLVGMNLGPDGRAALPAIPTADYLAALNGLAAVLMALLRRERTGLGDRIDISMHDCAIAALPNVLGPTLAHGRQPVASEERTTGGAAFYRLYETGDGRQIALAGQEMKFVRAVLEAFGRPDLVDLCARGPGSHQAPVADFLQEVFARMTLPEAEARLEGLGACFGAVKTLPEAIDDPNVLARGMIVADGEGRRHLGSPIRFQSEPGGPKFEVPSLEAARR